MQRALILLFLPLAFAACTDAHGPLVQPDEAGAARATPYGDLAARFREVAPEVMALPQTVFASRDEATGQLVFGVEHRGVFQSVHQTMARLGVSQAAYRVEVTEPIHFMTETLRTRHRPTVGGLQIHFGNYLCTLGFNVDHEGGRSFITNSHCTNNQGTTGTTAYFQPTSSIDPTPIGVEADDPAYFKGGVCSKGKVCRYSDAARVLYNTGSESSRGVIAKTSGMNNELGVNGSFTITDQDVSTTHFSAGGIFHKVGRTTGWTSGTVARSADTCATINVFGSNIQMLCQTRVTGTGTIVQSGDSGSPVFQITKGDDVELVGILWGGSSGGGSFIFSALMHIQEELGAVVATSAGSGSGGGGDPSDDPDDPEPPSDLQASFTYNCSNGPTCSFTDTSTGGSNSLTWDFQNGETAQGPSVSTTYSLPGTYTVTLTVTWATESKAAEQSITCRQQGPNLRCR
jgi:hypothetical protein